MDFLKDAASKLGSNNQQGQQSGIPGSGSGSGSAGYPTSQQGHGSGSGGVGGLLGSLGGGGSHSGQQQQQGGSSTGGSHGGSGGFLGGLGDKFNSAAGGGKESEKNEDMLDKGIDFVQEKFLGQGPQNNETAMEQAKDEQISDFIRKQYKSTTGKDVPIKDKETRFG